jgi:hypothetical protein
MGGDGFLHMHCIAVLVPIHASSCHFEAYRVNRAIDTACPSHNGYGAAILHLVVLMTL